MGLMSTPNHLQNDNDDVCRVLIVEDNADASTMLAKAVQRQGFEFQIARNGTEALVVASVFRPHIAIIDIGLPGLDGFHVARELRKTGADLLIIAATGRDGAADVERSREAGFDHHMTKPLDLAFLVHILAEWKAS